MIFFPLVKILNISIILMMIIVFFNNSSAKKPTLFFQLANRDDINYFVYLSRELNYDEKKLNIHDFYLSIHNLEARQIPRPTDKSHADLNARINQYCRRIPKLPYEKYIQDFDVYYDPAYATDSHCGLVFRKLVVTLYTCFGSSTSDGRGERYEGQPKLISDEPDEETKNLLKKHKSQLDKHEAEIKSLYQDLQNKIPTALLNLLQKALDNQNENDNESDAGKTKCLGSLKNLFSGFRRVKTVFQSSDKIYAQEVITKIGKAFQKQGSKLEGVRQENKFYQCMLMFKNGVTELNRNIGINTPARMLKKIPDRKIIKPELISYENMTDKNADKFRMSNDLKEKILEIDEINFLKALAENAKHNVMHLEEWLKTFTGDYKAKTTLNKNYEKNCLDGIEIMDKLNFKATKISKFFHYKYLTLIFAFAFVPII
ncbi:uncharacterized protein LOC114130702 isoform X3 [Aphis gossypii]|uniref:uncharacterized protein LOC114130702 isoform X3 n=1 Tax=Aphis gossypii TaxID=80765 RepID=UPI002159500E|nr:uncharacterized protein LOC114130702 isoform X3 [Aphis gossypii]